jgi:hypothetical protein
MKRVTTAMLRSSATGSARLDPLGAVELRGTRDGKSLIRLLRPR